MICPNCLTDTDRAICPSCGQKLLRVQKRKILLSILILFVLILLCLVGCYLIEIDTTYDQTYIAEVPYITPQLTTQPEQLIKKECEERDFEFDRKWLGINNYGAFSIPYLEISNLEDRWGLFEFNFSYFDQAKYDYSDFKDREYDEFKDELSRDMADMHSPNLEVWFGPGEKKTITYQARKPTNDKEYWALASVVAPRVYTCETRLHYENVTKENLVVRYEEEIQTRRVVLRKSLLSIFLSMDWFEILLITIPLFVILLLVLRLAKRLSKSI